MFTFPVRAPLFGCWSPVVSLIDPEREELDWQADDVCKLQQHFPWLDMRRDPRRQSGKFIYLYRWVIFLSVVPPAAYGTSPLSNPRETITKKRKEETITYLPFEPSVPGCVGRRIASAKDQERMKHHHHRSLGTEIKSELLYMPRWNLIWLGRSAFRFCIHLRSVGN